MPFTASTSAFGAIAERILGGMLWSLIGAVVVAVGTILLACLGYPGVETVGDKLILPPEIGNGSLLLVIALATFGAARGFRLP